MSMSVEPGSTQPDDDRTEIESGVASQASCAASQLEHVHLADSLVTIDEDLPLSISYAGRMEMAEGTGETSIVATSRLMSKMSMPFQGEW